MQLSRYVIRRTDPTLCRGWYWAGCGCWTRAVNDARLFESTADAELMGFAECPLPLGLWDVVPIEASADQGFAA
jgi:hypothetical protein